ncbi:MAG: aldo/keto reductase [Anaerolineales bacterium]
MLAGKYSSENPPPGVRGSQYVELLKKLPPVLKLIQEIGQNHGGKTASQVALNWLICKWALPIPGAKNIAQAEQNAGGAGWQMTEEEVSKLDEATDNIREYSSN